MRTRFYGLALGLSLSLIAPIEGVSVADEPAVERYPEPFRQWYAEQEDQTLRDYVYLHTHPELSLEEKETAAYIAKAWREAGYEVTEGVGGTGVVALLKNGPGPTVMLRCDMDALPVTEKTGLPYASAATATDNEGRPVGIMHACGHDVHMANMLAVARAMAEHRDAWKGTLMLIAQPAEERGLGAAAMLKDGLFERWKKPDYAVALHVASEIETGKIGLLGGYFMANVDSVDITMKGRGGHGSAPHQTIDPIVQAAELTMSLQTIVSREIDPTIPAVVTVGAIHGGTKHNIIGDDCHLMLTVRSYGEEVRNKLYESIRRRALAIAAAYGAPEPEIRRSEGTPNLYNDPELTRRIESRFKAAFGEDIFEPQELRMGGEDFGRYGIAGVPIVMYRLGTIEPRRMQQYTAAGSGPPSTHSPLYYPDPEGTLLFAFETMTVAALELLD